MQDNFREEILWRERVIDSTQSRKLQRYLQGRNRTHAINPKDFRAALLERKQSYTRYQSFVLQPYLIRTMRNVECFVPV